MPFGLFPFGHVPKGTALRRAGYDPAAVAFRARVIYLIGSPVLRHRSTGHLKPAVPRGDAGFVVSRRESDSPQDNLRDADNFK